MKHKPLYLLSLYAPNLLVTLFDLYGKLSICYVPNICMCVRVSMGRSDNTKSLEKANEVVSTAHSLWNNALC